jgi:hypothetical protein
MVLVLMGRRSAGALGHVLPIREFLVVWLEIFRIYIYPIMKNMQIEY